MYSKEPIPLYYWVLRNLRIFHSVYGNIIKIMKWHCLHGFLFIYNKLDML